jgi:predicted anti-sigma-YlaC factor YlaD
MTEHLSNQLIEGFRRKTIAVADLPAADAHLAACAECRRKLGEAEALETLTRFFRRDAEMVSAHLGFEQIEALFRGGLNSDEKHAVEEHLQDCSSCRTEVEELRAFAAEFDAQPIERFAPRELRDSPARETKPDWRENLRQWFAGVFFFNWQMAAAAAVALLILAATVYFRRSTPKQEITFTITPTPAPSAQPTLPPEAPPSSPAVESLPPAIDLALQNETLNLPAEIARMRAFKGDQRGTENRDERVALSSPVAVFVNSETPALRWRPLPGANSYDVIVSDDGFDVIASAAGLTATQWTIDKRLARGRKYSWQVTASKDGKPTSPATAVFRVLEKAKADELARARQKYGANRLALGAFYAQAGLVNEAAAEWQADGSEKARRLLRKLRTKNQ